MEELQLEDMKTILKNLLRLNFFTDIESIYELNEYIRQVMISINCTEIEEFEKYTYLKEDN